MNGHTPEWTPEYPGQIEPVWTWWDRDEPEDGLVGFHTFEDCRRFSDGKPGPYRRRISPTGKTISQTEDWRGLVDRLTREPRP